MPDDHAYAKHDFTLTPMTRSAVEEGEQALAQLTDGAMRTGEDDCS